MAELSYEDGRIWFQDKKFVPHRLLLPYGMTDVTDPNGALNAVREPDSASRRSTVVVDILRGEPGLPGFSLETRLKRTKNYLLGLRKKGINVQAHLGQCGRPDKYNASDIGLQWENVLRGDMTIDRLAILQGDNAPVGVSVPFNAQVGPLPVDFKVELLSARSIGEIEAISDMAFIKEVCDDISVQYDAGDNGYVVTNAASGSPIAEADIWYTDDAGESWKRVTSDAMPFGSGEDISSVVVIGEKNDHRVIISRGTADDSNPAEIAYADVTTMGEATWVYVNVGSVDGQFINHMFWMDWSRLFAVTNDGYVYLSKDGGATWTAKLTTAAVNLTEVGALRDGTVWVVGASNTVYLSESFGDAWTSKTGPSAGAGDSNDTVYVSPDGTVFIGNDAGELYGSYDDAKTWTALSLQGVTPTAIKRVRGTDDSNVWVALNLADGSGREIGRAHV